MKLTVTVITHNEARNLADALASVSWADEIVVVDSNSTDDTIRIAQRYATRIEQHEWVGYGEQKNYAVGIASHEWILSVDADERVSPGLAEEIQRIMRNGPQAAGYRMPRLTWYLGRWLHTTDWYPDHQLRLFDRRVARWNTRRVHESVEIDGPVATLKHDLLHYPYRDVSDHLISIDRYTSLAAEQSFSEGRRARAIDAAIYPPAAFLRNYVLRGGLRDGAAGLLVSALNSYYVFLKTVKLWELQNDATRAGAGRLSPRPPSRPDSTRAVEPSREPASRTTPAP